MQKQKSSNIRFNAFSFSKYMEYFNLLEIEHMRALNGYDFVFTFLLPPDILNPCENSFDCHSDSQSFLAFRHISQIFVADN